MNALEQGKHYESDLLYSLAFRVRESNGLLCSMITEKTSADIMGDN